MATDDKRNDGWILALLDYLDERSADIGNGLGSGADARVQRLERLERKLPRPSLNPSRLMRSLSAAHFG